MTPDYSSSFDDANLLANIVETADDAIISKDLTGTITSWNRAAERIFGYGADEVIGGPISVIIPPERGEEEIEILGRIRRGEKIEHFETERMRKDGTRVAVSVSISPLFKDGQVIGASKIARDISDQKRALQQLEEERARLEVTLASIGDAVIVTDVDGAVRFMNPIAEAMTGWSAAEARGQALESVFHIVNEKTRRRAENPTIKALRDGLVVGLANHTVLISKSGSEYSIDDSAAPICDGTRQVSGVVLVFRDVSGAKAQEAFRARLAAIVQSSDDAIISKDLTGRITSWNPGATRLFGYEAEEAIGRPISILIPPDRLNEETMVLAQLRRGERIEHLDTIRITKDRRKINVLLTISPVHDVEGNIIGASKIARDITDLKRTEQELAEARTRLEKYSQELEETVRQRTAELQAANQELEAFSYTAAHDLRTPLRNMRGILQLFEEEVAPGLPAERQELISRLSRSAERMSQLLEALLDFSRIGKHHLQRTRTALDELLQRAIAELRPEIEKRQVEWKTGALPIVECDPGLMEQALINLLSNALKYTQPRPVARIEVGQVPHEGNVAIYVRDNGIGFSMEQADKLFTPFHRLHPERQFKGSGIGLATVDRIIRRHGGRVWAESKPDEGATFYFTLGTSSGNPSD
ncbi:MAG TPA: PAS domain S-box protein [Candidatus Limnocylindrales bacterium]|jgi:PAS domain S-box-containing protein|nr:PAS domain S-box protein [Candidatus Limnocylindrales bacterium]